jgi:hypothetical protein
MTADELFAEAQKIARPCVYLANRPEVGPLAGVWGGKGIVPVAVPDHRHWLSIDCSILPKEFEDLKLTGWLSVYTNEADCESGRCIVDANVKSVQVGSRTPLHARPGTTLPTLACLLRSPTPAIRQWLTEVGCDVSERFFSGTEGVKKPGDGYMKKYFESEPMGGPDESVFGRIGGWPLEVYEDDWAEDVKDPRARQLLYTYQDSEPWVRVAVKASGDFIVQQLIT